MLASVKDVFTPKMKWRFGRREMLILRLLKKIFCKHDWEKVWFDISWQQTEQSYVEERWCCKCKKCGRKKIVVFENRDVLIDGRKVTGKKL